MSASRVMSRGQKYTALLVSSVSGSAFIVAPVPTLTILIGIATLFYLFSVGYKVRLAIRALSGTRELVIHPDSLDATPDEKLPFYTILVPLYHEANVLADLVDAISRIDYPPDRLEVKLLLEKDDPDTRAAADRMELPQNFEKMVVPAGTPKGKPRACNYGLLYARGRYVVLLDAEDRPEPDQLRQAAAAFEQSGPKTACVQAKLSYYNSEQNLLTRWFTAEYSSWFDLYLPGLHGGGVPIPLGGTSNHFDVRILRTLGAWDPFNVTEDADLGIRLARDGYETRVIDSVTYEEANSELGNWLRQRSRWVKGYMQTWLVHMRDPARLWRELGTDGFLAVQAMILGTVFTSLALPIFWTLTVLWFTTNSQFIHDLFPWYVYYPALLALVLGNSAVLYLGLAGLMRRGAYPLVKYAILLPAYWLLITAGAYRGLYQLVVKPFYWEKTRHGLTPEARSATDPLPKHAE